MKHVVIDEGSSQAKICWFDEKICTALIPSRVVQGAALNAKVLGNYDDAAYRIGSQEYTVADAADGALRTDILDYQFSDYNLAIVHEVLRQNGFGGQDVSITTTLPIKDFFEKVDGRPLNKPLINKKKANLVRGVESMESHNLANIVNVDVMPEAIPAWMDYLINDAGEQAIEVDNRNKVMVVDLGGTTTDISIIDGYGRMQKYDSLRGGVFEVADRLEEKLRARFARARLEKYHLEDALKQKTFAGEDISKEISEACLGTEDRIIDEMKKMNTESSNLDVVLYVGGGAQLMGQSLAKRYKGKTIIGNEFSIARGIMKQKIAQGLVA